MELPGSPFKTITPVACEVHAGHSLCTEILWVPQFFAWLLPSNQRSILFIRKWGEGWLCSLSFSVSQYSSYLCFGHDLPLIFASFRGQFKWESSLLHWKKKVLSYQASQIGMCIRRYVDMRVGIGSHRQNGGQLGKVILLVGGARYYSHQ